MDGAGAEVLHPPLLKTKIGHRPLVSGVGHEGEVGGGVAEVLVEAGGERREEKLVAHLEPDVVELVGEGLEPETVGVDGGVVLVTPKKFLLQENNPLKLVVGEEAIDLGPHRVSIIPIANDGVEDVQRDGEEEPPDEGGVDGEPVGVVGAGKEIGETVHMITKVVLTEKEIEVGFPSIVICGGVGEDNGDVIGEVDVADVGGFGLIGLGPVGGVERVARRGAGGGGGAEG